MVGKILVLTGAIFIAITMYSVVRVGGKYDRDNN